MDPVASTTPAPQPVQPVLLSYATGPVGLRPIPVWLIPLLIPAVVGCCLPFAYSESPLTVAWAVLRHPAEVVRDSDRILAFLAYGLCLCIFWDASPGTGYFTILFCQPAYWFLAVIAFRS